MAHEQELRCCRSVERPYGKVKGVVANETVGLFQRATMSAVTHATLLGATLRANVAGHDVKKDVRIEITSVDLSGRPPSAMALPAIALRFAWRAASDASLFPSMRAELTIYPLSASETQLDLHGWYTPPGGAFGQVADALVGHRIAEASMDHFLEDVVRRLHIEAA